MNCCVSLSECWVQFCSSDFSIYELIIWFWYSDMATSDADVRDQILMLNRCDLAYINQSICKSEHSNFRQQIVHSWNLYILYFFTLLSSKLKYRVVDSNFVLTKTSMCSDPSGFQFCYCPYVFEHLITLLLVRSWLDWSVPFELDIWLLRSDRKVIQWDIVIPFFAQAALSSFRLVGCTDFFIFYP